MSICIYAYVYICIYAYGRVPLRPVIIIIKAVPSKPGKKNSKSHTVSSQGKLSRKSSARRALAHGTDTR